MAQKTSVCSIKLAIFCIGLCLWMALPTAAQTGYGQENRYRQRAQTTKQKEKEENIPQYPWFNGVSIGLDLWGPGSKLLGGDALNAGLSIDVDLKHRIFPTMEIGFGNADAWSDDGIHYRSSGPFFRIGADYNALYKKKHGHMLLVGLRYGISHMEFDVATMPVSDPIYGGGLDNPLLTDDIWGGSIAFNHQGMKASMQWLEFCLGIRAHIWKSLYMGWSIRMKYKLSGSPDRYGDPWQVPGFGKYGSNTMGVTYHIVYKLPF